MLATTHYSRTARLSFAQVAAVLTVAATLAFAQIAPTGPFHVARQWLFDSYQVLWPPTREATRTIVVDIDDESIRRIGQWPWPRQTLALLIDRVRDARVIGIDILLPDADRLAPMRMAEQMPDAARGLREALLALPDPDTVLAETMRALPVVLAISVGDDRKPAEPAPVVLPPVRERGISDHAALYHADAVSWPLPVLARAAQGIGVISAPRARSGVVNTLPAVVDVGGSALPGFTTALLLVALNAGGIVLSGGNGGLTSVSIDQLTIPTDKSGGIHPRFVGAARMTTIPAYRLLNATAELPSTRNRIVVIGVAAAGIGETFVTPTGVPISGGMLQAEAIESILAGDTLWRPFWAHSAELMVGTLISIVVGLNLGRMRYRESAVLVAVALALPIIGSIFLFVICNILLDSVYPVSSLLLTCAVASTARFGAEVKARQQREAELAVAQIRRGAAERETRLRDDADGLRQNLALAIDAAQLGIWDANLTSGEWHHTARHDMILGLASSPDRWSTAILVDHVVPEERDRVIRGFAAAETDGALRLECRINWPDGSVHHVQMLGRFWHDHRDQTARVAGVVADVTHQRTLELRLRQGEKMQSVGLLAGGVAHNFNNLLMVVLGSLEVAQRKVDPATDSYGLLANAREAAVKAADIARQLLTFARLQPLRARSIDPAMQLQNVVPLLRNALPAKVVLDLVMPETLPPIEIDPVEFDLALLNLAMNARDAMPLGGRLGLHAFARHVFEPKLGLDGQYVVLEVIDDGPGIPPDILPRVFEPFFTTKDIGKGTGLGLSQVHGFVHQSGGAVDIDSTPGAGTCIRLYLPVSRQQA